MPVILLMIIGAAAGFIATRVMKVEADIITTVVIGTIGAVIGGLLLRTLIAVMGMAAGFVGALLGAFLVIWLWQRYIQR